MEDKFSIQIYWWEDENCWYACIPEVVALGGTGQTREEAMKNAVDALHDVMSDEEYKIYPWILRNEDGRFPIYEVPEDQ